MNLLKKLSSLLLTTFLLSSTIPTTLSSGVETAESLYPDFSIGNSLAPVQIEVFDDFQCPYCADFHNTLFSQEIRTRFIDKGIASITFRDYPLSFHRNALPAAYAANAVHRNNPEAYFDFMETLFKNQADWGNAANVFDFFAEYALNLGITRAELRQYYDDDRNALEIQNDINEGKSRSINGTPTYYVNGTGYTGAQSETILIQQIKNAYQASQIASEKYNVLKSNINNKQNGTIIIYPTQRIELTLDKSENTRWKTSKWHIEQDERNPSIKCFEKNEPLGPIDKLSCQATETYGLVHIHGANADNPRQSSNVLSISIARPSEGTEIPCITPPKHHIPGTCIDRHAGGFWIRNYFYECFRGYEKRGNRCYAPLLDLTPVDKDPKDDSLSVKIESSQGEGIINLELNEIISFSATVQHSPLYRIQSANWNIPQYLGKSVLECNTNDNNTYTIGCKAANPGKVTISYHVSSSDGTDVIKASSNEITLYVGEIEQPGPPPALPEYFDLQLKTSYGEDFIELLVGEKISFFATINPPTGFNVDKAYWNVPQYLSSNILDCHEPISGGNVLECEAIKPGKTIVNFSATASNGFETREADSSKAVVYVDEVRRPILGCPSYPPPPCPNGRVYYPPAADGCLGEPICRSTGGNISSPIAGYEDEVRVRFREQENPFTDIDVGTLAGKASAELFYRGVIGGFPDGEFKGDRQVTRAAAAKFLMLARGINTTGAGQSNPFLDVILEEWYGPFVIKAAELGIIKGYEDKNFRPGNGVQRDEFLVMLTRTFDLPTRLEHDFVDYEDYPDAWFWKYAGIASKYDLFPGEKELQPETKMTRNEVATAIYQYLRNR